MDNQTVSPHTLQRIGYLHNPGAIDELLDLFQHLGVSMRSDTWAEQSICLIKRMETAEITLSRVENAIETFSKDVKCRDYRDLWCKKYQQFVDESIVRIREREVREEAEYLAKHKTQQPAASVADVSSPSLDG